MKNRTKTISLLIAVCMMLTLLPAVALAEGEDTVSVSIAGRPLNSSTPYYINGAINGEDVGAGSTHANVSDDNWNAYFDSSANTLTLKNIKYNTWTGATPLEVTGTGTTLTIILEGNNILEVGPGNSAISASGKTIVIQGSGSLTAYSSNSGNGITGNVTVSSGSLTAYGSLGTGIEGNVTVSGGSLNAYSGNWALGISGTLDISGGTVEASSSGQGIGSAITISSGFNPQVRSGVNKSWGAKVNTTFTSGGTITDGYVYIGPAIYLVSFNANVHDPHEIEGRMEPQYINKGEGKPLTPNAFTRDGYTFNGWNTDRNGNGTAYTDKESITPTEDITLYAQWTQNNTGTGGGTSGGTTPTPKTYSISFNRNTQDPDAAGNMEAQIFTENVPQAIKANEFSVPGYVFKGWNTEQNGGGISYADQQEITLNEGIMTGRSGFSLYAQWGWDTSGGGTGGTTGGNTGNIQHTTKPEDNQMNGDIAMDNTDIFNSVLNEKEKNSGKDIKVYLKVEDKSTVTNDEKTAIENKANGDKVAAYLDISLYKKVGENKPVAVPNPTGKIKIKIVIPENIFNANHTYYIIYRHNGETKTLTGELNKQTREFTFEANEFSTYALAYKENTNPGSAPGTVDPGTSSGIDLWYNGGNSFGSSNSAVPTSVEIDNLPVSFTGNGREFTVGCISPNAKWVTVNWNSTSVTTNFTPDANATCAEITLPKTGDVSVMAFALMAVVAAAGAMGKK